MTERAESSIKLALVVGSGVAVAYFGLDRTIPWLPKAVHYGIAGGAATYLGFSKPNNPAINTFNAMGGAIVGIVGGEVTNYFL